MDTIHIISHTHWDREWYLTFQQFRLKLVRLIDGLLEILEQDPEFKHFMLDGQTIILHDYLQIRPEKEAVLRAHIQSGRILIGPWYILPDMFLVSPEAHIRNLLQGARDCRKFGPRMNVAYIPDSFGHPGQVPQIVKGFDLQAACVWRGLDDQPPEIWWQAPDGARVFMAYLRDSYSNGAGLPTSDLPQFTRQLSQARDALAAVSQADAFLVMFGTDHMAPSADTSAAIAYANRHLPETTVLHSTLPAYLEQIQPLVENGNIPTVRGELRSSKRVPLLPGVLSTRMWIKQSNHASQNRLEKWAEPFSVFAEQVIGAEKKRLPQQDSGREQVRYGDRLSNPEPVLRQGWRLLMENHPHDSICGCSIDQVHDEMRPRFDQVDQITEEIINQSLKTLASAITTQSEGACSAIVVFNPTGILRSEIVPVKLNLPESIGVFEIVDQHGVPLQHQASSGEPGEIANLIIEKNGLADILASVHEGQVGGMAIQALDISLRGTTGEVQAVLAKEGRPDLEAWENGLDKIRSLIADETVTQFHIRAHTPVTTNIEFYAPDIPPFGWRVFWVREIAPFGNKPSNSVQINPLIKPLLPFAMRFTQSSIGSKMLARLTDNKSNKPPYYLENDYFRIEAHPELGVLSLLDKRSGVEYPGLGAFISGGDAGDEYNYSPPVHDRLIQAKMKRVRVASDLIIPTLEIDYQLQAPLNLNADRESRTQKTTTISIRSIVRLPPHTPRVEFETTVTNRARDHRLRVHFPAPCSADHAIYDGHYEIVRRPIGLPVHDQSWQEAPRQEAPQRAFVALSDGQRGLVLANRGLPEVEVFKNAAGQNEIALTLLRCVEWLSRDDLRTRIGHAGPAEYTPGAQMLGSWTFHYALIPVAGEIRDEYHEAFAFETPCRAIASELHDGSLPNCGAFFEKSPKEFIISAIKETEDQAGWLLRGYNISQSPIEVKVKPWRAFSHVERIDLSERRIEALQPHPDGSIRWTLRPHGVDSIKFTH